MVRAIDEGIQMEGWTSQISLLSERGLVLGLGYTMHTVKVQAAYIDPSYMIHCAHLSGDNAPRFLHRPSV